MGMPKIDFAKLAAFVQSEANLVVGAVREKGGRYFQRPFAVAGAIIGVSYLVYLQPISRQAHIEAALNAAKATEQYNDQYKDIHDTLYSLYRQLPLIKDRDQFLFNALIDSLKEENIVSDSLKPPSEDENATLIYQTVTMTSRLKFSEFISWLSRIESAKPTLRVVHFDLSKQVDQIGQNNVSCSIVTIIPKVRY